MGLICCFQEELREVFEGSCNLIPVKVISKECCKLADEFIPELVETLASEMNPQVVCSVAGLCNNAWVDKQLAESKVCYRRQHVFSCKPDILIPTLCCCPAGNYSVNLESLTEFYECQYSSYDTAVLSLLYVSFLSP